MFFIYKNFFVNSVFFCHCRGSFGPPYIKNSFFSKKIFFRDYKKLSFFKKLGFFKSFCKSKRIVLNLDSMS